MDYVLEQEMEVEALQAILMDDIQEMSAEESSLSARSFRILVSAEEDADGETSAACIAVVFAHTPCYPDEPPLIDVQAVKGVRDSETRELKEKLLTEAAENLGMAMMYTLVTSAKEWLSERFSQGTDSGSEDGGEGGGELDEVVEPHGEVVTVETFLAWRERFEAEAALERARLMPEAALLAPKEKKLTGRAWFESGRASAVKTGKVVVEESEEEAEEDIDFDADDEDVDEDDMLEHYLSSQQKV